MSDPISVDLDDTTGCPLGDRCEGCTTAMGLEVCTVHAMGGVLCLTLCRSCEAPAWGPTTAALRTLAHAGHLGIDTDQMGAQLKRGRAQHTLLPPPSTPPTNTPSSREVGPELAVQVGPELAAEDTPAYVTDLDAAQGEIGALAFWLAEVTRLADDADGMTAGPLREEIRRVAGHVRDRDSVHRAGEATP